MPSLWYPFGRDQAIFSYGGRVWLAGDIPYRDFFDVKPPGVFLVHALLHAVAGGSQWLVRALDVLAVFACGVMASRHLDADRVAAHGASGMLALAWYFTTFDYWDTAQTEVWQAFLVVVSWSLVRRARAHPPWAAAIGACLGAACLFKLTAAVFALPLAYALSASDTGWRASSKLFGWSIAGGVGMLSICVGYFAMHNATGELFDALVGLAAHYARYTAASSADTATAIRVFVGGHLFPSTAVITIGAIGTSLAARRRTGNWFRASDIGQVLLWVAAFGAVAIQRKFFPYHWGVLLAPVAFACAKVVHVTPRSSRLSLATAVALSMMCFAFCPAWPTNGDVNTVSHAAKWWAYVRGKLSRDQYLAQFRGHYGYNYASVETIGKRLAERQHGGDELVVQGFEMTIYEASGLQAPTRFAATHWLTDNRLTYRRDEWRAEYIAALTNSPPRFIVQYDEPLVFFGTRDLFMKHRYVPILRVKPWTIYDRVNHTPIAPY